MKRVVDVVMLALIPPVMAYELTGNTIHEITGTLLILLIIGHTALNWRRFTAIPRMRWSRLEIARFLIIFAMVVALVGMTIGAVRASQFIFRFLGMEPDVEERRIHVGWATWLFVLMSIHAGFQMGPAIFKRWKKSRASRWPVFIAIVIVAVYGAWIAIRQNFFSKMIFLDAFALPSEFSWRPLVDHMSVIVTMGLLGVALSVGLRRRRVA